MNNKNNYLFIKLIYVFNFTITFLKPKIIKTFAIVKLFFSVVIFKIKEIYSKLDKNRIIYYSKKIQYINQLYVKIKINIIKNYNNFVAKINSSQKLFFSTVIISAASMVIFVLFFLFKSSYVVNISNHKNNPPQPFIYEAFVCNSYWALENYNRIISERLIKSLSTNNNQAYEIDINQSKVFLNSNGANGNCVKTGHNQSTMSNGVKIYSEKKGELNYELFKSKEGDNFIIVGIIHNVNRENYTKLEPDVWKTDVEYTYQKFQSNNWCNKSEKTVCLNLEKYKEICNLTKGVTVYANKVNAGNSGSKIDSLYQGGNIDNVEIYWSSNDQCRVKVTLSGIYQGTSTREYLRGRASSFIYTKNNEFLVSDYNSWE